MGPVTDLKEVVDSEIKCVYVFLPLFLLLIGVLEYELQGVAFPYAQSLAVLQYAS